MSLLGIVLTLVEASIDADDCSNELLIGVENTVDDSLLLALDSVDFFPLIFILLLLGFMTSSFLFDGLA